MCGIAGIINFNKEQTNQAADIHRMAQRIRHRGPDDEGYLLCGRDGCIMLYGDDTPLNDKEKGADDHSQRHIKNVYDSISYIALGHRRLSIIDLSFSGHQPTNYLDRYWIVYNGEVYNYIELRRELQTHGYSFHSHTDTEVVLAAYDKWGTSCLEKFNGMWAFVIYDARDNKLFLSRDRFGIKPLYYYKDDKSFIFASEIKAILECEKVITSPNIKYCIDYLAYGPMEHIKETAFENIFRFAHASFMEVGVDQLQHTGIKEQKFWDYKPNLTNEKYDEAKAQKYAERYYELLSDSVKIRLRADVKIGAALSGGLDSSTIAYIINQHLKEAGKTCKQETFSNVYKSDGARYCDESNYIDQLAKFLNVNSNQIEPQVQDIAREHEKMIYAMENPAIGSNMGGWYTFKCVARSNVTINLDGQGADEQLAGYFRYLWRYFINMPVSDIRKNYFLCSKIPEVRKSKLLVSIAINILNRLLPRNILIMVLRIFGVKEPHDILAPINQVLYGDTMGNQLIKLLHFGDSQSMAHSVESRVPFMDYRLVGFLASLPASYKIHNGWTKYIARIAMDSRLPDNITWRADKMGWPDPADYWFRGPLKEWLCRQVESSPFIKQLGVKHNIRKRIETKEDINNLVRLLNLGIWHKIFFGEACGHRPKASVPQSAAV